MKRAVLFSLVFFTFLSCDEIFECLIKIDPEIDQTSIREAVLDEPYSQFISGQVKNSVGDDFYEYYFEVLGPLPEGIYIEYNFRNIEIYGVPEETGQFRFTVLLTIGAYDDGEEFDNSPTCNGTTERSFILIVNEPE